MTPSLPPAPVSARATGPKQHTELQLAESQAQSPRAADPTGYKPEGSSEQFAARRFAYFWDFSEINSGVSWIFAPPTSAGGGDNLIFQL